MFKVHLSKYTCTVFTNTSFKDAKNKMYKKLWQALKITLS